LNFKQELTLIIKPNDSRPCLDKIDLVAL